MKLLKSLLSRTPKIGKNIRNAGLALAGLNGAVLTLPELPDSYIVLANIILAIVLALYGQKQTPAGVMDDAEKDLGPN